MLSPFKRTPSQNSKDSSQKDILNHIPTASKIIKFYKMNLKSTICCTLLFLNLVDATKNRHLRGRGPALSWSVITFPQDPDFGINTIPESFAPGEPNPVKPVDAQCAKPKLTGEGCIEIFSPVSCDDCIYENICFAKAAGFPREDCKPATNVQGQGQGQGQVHNTPVPGYTLPGNPSVINTVVFHNTPVPGDTLPGNPPTDIGPSTIAIGEPNPATPILIGDIMIPVNPSKPLEEPATGMRPSTIAIGEPNPAIPIPGTPGRIVPGKPSVSIFSGSEEVTSAYPVAPGRIVPGKPSVSIFSGSEEATSAYPDTPFMIIPGSPPVSVLIADEEAASGTSNAPLCRETRSNAICDEVIDPVRCGPANCMYGNLCLGIGAGFLETDCGSAR
jgi:hypothetical protein